MVTAVLVELQLEGHTELPGGPRLFARWVHRYWISESALLPLAFEIDEKEEGIQRRGSLHELIAADILGPG
jgi:hypothetical protein